MLRDILKATRREEAEVYLKGRGLELFSDVGYTQFYEIPNSKNISDSLVMPVYDASGDLLALDCKPITHGVYQKQYKNELLKIPVYNLTEVRDVHIVTEGILNAESLNQGLGIENAVATLRASVGTKVWHLLAFATNKKLIFAYDNDTAGITATKAMLKFFEEFYPHLELEVLDYPYNDLNDFLVNIGREGFKRHLLPQIKEV